MVGYRKKKVKVVCTETVKLCELNWSGGTRNEYHCVDIISGEISSPKLGVVHPLDNEYEGARIKIPEGTLILRTGHFLGKPSTMEIYVHPANFPALLPDLGRVK